MTTQHIKKLWREVADEYLKKFCEKMEFSIADAYWIGDDPGTIAQIGDYFVGIHEMRYLVDNNIAPDVFLKWYDYSLDIHSLQAEYNELEGFTSLVNINFESFAKGAPVPYSATDIEQMNESLASIRKAKEGFINKFKSLAK